MKRFAVAVLLACLTASYSHAQGTAMDFIRADRNPVTLAAAGAGYASAFGGTALSALSAPAVIALGGNTVEAAGVFSMLPSSDGRTMSYGGGASARFGSFGIGAAYIGSSYPVVPLYSEGGGTSGKFTPSDVTVTLGLSFAMGEHFSLGLAGRYAGNTLDTKTALSSLSADVMALYRNGALSVAAGAAGLGPKVSSIGNKSYPLPASARLGASYGLEFGDFGLDLAVDGDYYFSGNFSAAAGLQAGFRDMVFLRTGYRYSSVKEDFVAAPVPSFFSAGLGVKFFGVSLDVAYLPLQGTLAASLGYRF